MRKNFLSKYHNLGDSVIHQKHMSKNVFGFLFFKSFQWPSLTMPVLFRACQHYKHGLSVKLGPALHGPCISKQANHIVQIFNLSPLALCTVILDDVRCEADPSLTNNRYTPIGHRKCKVNNGSTLFQGNLHFTLSLSSTTTCMSHLNCGQ